MNTQRRLQSVLDVTRNQENIMSQLMTLIINEYTEEDNEENINTKISPGGFGGESIERTNDNGFIISTGGGTVLKTDSDLSY